MVGSKPFNQFMMSAVPSYQAYILTIHVAPFTFCVCSCIGEEMYMSLFYQPWAKLCLQNKVFEIFIYTFSEGRPLEIWIFMKAKLLSDIADIEHLWKIDLYMWN